MPERVICDLCTQPIAPDGQYILKMEIFADPATEPIDLNKAEEANPAATMKQLIQQMNQMTTDELQDQVHRQFEFRLCRTCQMAFLINPLGKPRGTKLGSN